MDAADVPEPDSASGGPATVPGECHGAWIAAVVDHAADWNLGEESEVDMPVQDVVAHANDGRQVVLEQRGRDASKTAAATLRDAVLIALPHRSEEADRGVSMEHLYNRYASSVGCAPRCDRPVTDVMHRYNVRRLHCDHMAEVLLDERVVR